MSEIVAELAANVWNIVAVPGDRVQAGDTVILELMKMGIPVAEQPGVAHHPALSSRWSGPRGANDSASIPCSRQRPVRHTFGISPPSTRRMEPVMYEARALARNATASAYSRGSP